MAKKKYYQRPDGLYETTRTLPNGKKKRFRGRTVKEVDQKILAYKEEQESGRPFDVVAGEWWETMESTATDSTTTTYKAYYTRSVEYFGSQPIGTIKPMQVQRFIGDQCKKGFANGTINIQKTVINQIFDHAVSYGEIERNVAREAKKPKHLPQTIRQPLTVEQEKKVKAYQIGESGLMGQMLLYSGMRIGELMALQWGDIDRKNGVIHVTKKINYATGNRGVLEDHLKSENGKRDIPLLAPLKEILPRDRIGLVFPQENGDHLPKHRQRKIWMELCGNLGLLLDDGNPAITPHQLRHSFATICYEAGVDIKTCAKWMGDTEDVVAKIYQALRPHQEKKGVELVNEYLQEMDAMQG